MENDGQKQPDSTAVPTETATQNSDPDQVLLVALRAAVAKFPFHCRVHSILARTRYNVVARVSLAEDGSGPDYVLKTNMEPEDSYFLQQAWAVRGQSDLEESMPEFVLPMLFLWGHGIRGTPTYLRLQSYLRGRTLRDCSFGELLRRAPELMPDLSRLSGKIVARFLRTGVVVDTSSCYVQTKSWIKRLLLNIWWNFSFRNTSNVMIEDGTNHVFIVDTNSSKECLGLGHPSLKMNLKILAMFVGTLCWKIVFDLCILWRSIWKWLGLWRP